MTSAVAVFRCGRPLALAITGLLLTQGSPVAQGQPQRPLRITLTQQKSEAVVRQFEKFEVDFRIDGATATFMHWPYDASPPSGVPAGLGISADAVFVNPSGIEYRQPAFYYQHFLDEVRNNRDWHYPTADFVWKVRFTPNERGVWKYRIVASDRGGSAETTWNTFTVEPSPGRGFIQVSRSDPRYFEFEDGTFFSGLGFQIPEFLEDPTTRGEPFYRELGANGVNFARVWISSLYGSAWSPWVGGRNRYNGYLPVTGVIPFRPEGADETTLSMRIDYEPGGDTGWFDGCRVEQLNIQQAVKPNTQYRIRAVYSGRNITGPRNPRSPAFGFVAKMGGMFSNCYEAGTSRPVTGYGLDAPQWTELDGVWNSGNRYFLPKIHLALENARQGIVHVKSVSVREILPGGSEGPELLLRPSMEYESYIPQARAYAFDKIVQLAERYGVYLKPVVMEKSDEIYWKFEDNGEFVTSRDNQNGFYGTGRTVNKTRWLQQAWWRYVQARWGYSPSIHSWELVNEGDPASRRHYELADEFGKFMHYGVFGVDGSIKRAFDHPNDHLVTTSFWHSFPVTDFWGSPLYPNVDYADIHAYVSTSFAPPQEKARMQLDSAYYHAWHGQAAAAAHLGKPVVRGEAGLDVPGRQDERVLGVQRDLGGVWLHNFLWAGLDSDGLYELYWWRSHIWSDRHDVRGAYRRIGTFLSDLDLNKGGYVDWQGTSSQPALQVVGQKNVKAGRMHLWIRNAQHTWKRVVDGAPVEPVSGEIVVPGFRPGVAYRVEWWDTHAPEKTILAHENVTAASSGSVTLRVNSLLKDVALKVWPNTTDGAERR